MRAIDAKRILISDWLAALGHQPAYERQGEWWYLSPFPFRSEQEASFKLTTDQKAWFDHGLGQGGNIIALAQVYFGLGADDVSAALREIEKHGRGSSHTQTPLPFFDNSAPPALSPAPPAPVTHSAGRDIQSTHVMPLKNTTLLTYLRDKRCINLEVAQRYVQEVHFTMHGKARWFFALAFPNDSGGHEWRNASDARVYKRAWGHKDISTIQPQSGDSAPAVLVFEGFMDFLSALTHDDALAPKMPVIVMNGVSMKDRAVAAIRALGVETVYLYLDRDESGRQLTAEFQTKLADLTVLDQSDLYRGHKDFNAFWQQHRQLARR